MFMILIGLSNKYKNFANHAIQLASLLALC